MKAQPGPLPRGSWRVLFRRLAAVVVIGGYLSLTAGYHFLHILGDTFSRPASYFWTWDMFPGYASESYRLIAVGQTEAGRYVRLHPRGGPQFLGGVHRDLTRIELIPAKADASGKSFFQLAAERQVMRTRPALADDPLVKVLLFEEYWPSRFNLTPELYEAVYEEPRPDRSYWRVTGRGTVFAEGAVVWEGT